MRFIGKPEHPYGLTAERQARRGTAPLSQDFAVAERGCLRGRASHRGRRGRRDHQCSAEICYQCRAFHDEPRLGPSAILPNAKYPRPSLLPRSGREVAPAGSTLIELLRPGDVGIAAHGVALLAPGHSAVVEGTGEFWIEPDRLVVIGNGAVILPFVAIRVAAVVECLAQVGIELYRLGVVGDRAIELAFRAPFDAATRIGDGLIAFRQLARPDGTGAGRDRRRRKPDQCRNDTDCGSATRRAKA